MGGMEQSSVPPIFGNDSIAEGYHLSLQFVLSAVLAHVHSTCFNPNIMNNNSIHNGGSNEVPTHTGTSKL